MKKHTLSIFATVILALTAKAQIPNAGFETWTTIGAYDIPMGWGTMNNATSTNSVYTATKGTPGSPGNSYLKLTSKTNGASVANGIAVSGKLDTITLKPKSGFAFTQRPSKFTGKWQHMIYGSSQGSVKVLTTKWNTTLNKRDTIAHSEQGLSGMAMSWANFSMNMMYVDSLQFPDSCIIVLQASGSNPTNNDYLWVDNLAFTGTVAIYVDTTSTVGIKENKQESRNLSIFPSPANEFVQISLSLSQAQALSIEVFDIAGKLYRCERNDFLAGEIKEKINVKDLPAGTYFIKVTGKTFTETKKIVIE